LKGEPSYFIDLSETPLYLPWGGVSKKLEEGWDEVHLVALCANERNDLMLGLNESKHQENI